jgi:hypothetical protein
MLTFVNDLSLWHLSFCFSLMLIPGVVFILAQRKCRAGHFYGDTPVGFLLGIYVWGDALILAPFWCFSGLFFLFLPLLMILRYILIFFALRAAYEVIFWLNHQAVKDGYCPPLFRQVRWIKTNDAAILYQLLNFCLVVVFTSLIVWSFF